MGTYENIKKNAKYLHIRYKRQDTSIDESDELFAFEEYISFKVEMAIGRLVGVSEDMRRLEFHIPCFTDGMFEFFDEWNSIGSFVGAIPTGIMERPIVQRIDRIKIDTSYHFKIRADDTLHGWDAGKVLSHLECAFDGNNSKDKLRKEMFNKVKYLKIEAPFIGLIGGRGSRYLIDANNGYVFGYKFDSKTEHPRCSNFVGRYALLDRDKDVISAYVGDLPECLISEDFSSPIAFTIDDEGFVEGWDKNRITGLGERFTAL